jgi:RNA polymerase sigma factor (sigma-70 family)
VSPIGGDEERATLPRGISAARKRAAIETFVRYESALRRTAQRYSLCADDADDALQRALEILLLKAPTEDPRELIRWTQTVVKHEALAVRRDRERILSGPAAAPRRDSSEDWVALIPSPADGPPERAERRETVARSREALQTLKPQELRALSLLAEGYTYAEIGEITGFSRTKINRCLAEGRERFRSFLARSSNGQRCAEMGPLLSAYCDGEAAADQAAALKEHLRACANCRATLRAYRAAPRAAAALAPTLPLARSLLDRAHDALAGLSFRFSGASATDPALSQVAATGGARGAGMAALAKALAICVGTAGGAAACVATGVVPAPLAIDHGQTKAPVLERRIDPTVESEWTADAAVDYEPEPQPTSPQPAPEQPATHHEPSPAPEPAPSPVSAPTGAVEYAPEPAPVAEPSSSAESSGSSSGSAAGEFGP